MNTVDEVIQRINKDGFSSVDDMINFIINSKTVKNGLIFITFNEEKVRHVSVYDKQNLNYLSYDVVCAKRPSNDSTWILEKADEAQRNRALHIIKNHKS